MQRALARDKFGAQVAQLGSDVRRAVTAPTDLAAPEVDLAAPSRNLLQERVSAPHTRRRAREPPPAGLRLSERCSAAAARPNEFSAAFL